MITRRPRNVASAREQDAVGIDSVNHARTRTSLVRAERIIFPGRRRREERHGRPSRRAGSTARFARPCAAARPCSASASARRSSSIAPRRATRRASDSSRARTVRFKLNDPALKIPHIGWNEVRVEKPHPLLASFEPGDELYSVHSYYPILVEDPARVYATADYGGPSFAARSGTAICSPRNFTRKRAASHRPRLAPALLEVGRHVLSKRVIACLDVRDGKFAKSVKFVDTRDIGDPVEKAREYYRGGLDELVFLRHHGFERQPWDHARRRREGGGRGVHSVLGRRWDPVGGRRDHAQARWRRKDQRQQRRSEGPRPHRAVLRRDRRAERGAVDGRSQIRAEQPTIPSGYEIVIHGGRTPRSAGTRSSGRSRASGSARVSSSSIRSTRTARARVTTFH